MRRKIIFAVTAMLVLFNFSTAAICLPPETSVPPRPDVDMFNNQHFAELEIADDSDIRNFFGRNFDEVRQYFGEVIEAARPSWDSPYAYNARYDTGVRVHVNDTENDIWVVVRINIIEESPFNFAGIKVGESTKEDVRELLGDPRFVNEPCDHGGLLNYGYSADASTDVWIYYQNDYVESITYQMHRDKHFNLTNVTLFNNPAVRPPAPVTAGWMGSDSGSGMVQALFEGWSIVVNSDIASELQATVDEIGLYRVIEALGRNGLTVQDIGFTITPEGGLSYNHKPSPPTIPIPRTFDIPDFALNLWVEESTMRQGENFTAEASLLSTVGETHRVVAQFSPIIPNWDISTEQTIIFEPEERFLMNYGRGIHETWTIGSTLNSGVHELKFRVDFILLGEEITLYSNTVELTVLPADNITVTINGTPLIFPDQNPTIADGRTLVPVRGVFEELGFAVAWDGNSQQAALTRNDDAVIITVGSSVFTANGKSHTLDVPAQIINGRTMLPIRAVLESVGYSVIWDAQTRSILIYS